MRSPDFFIIGAPKCGTTALYHYLNGYSDICLSKAKEPHYFCTDFPGYQWSKSEKEYLTKEFSDCNERHKLAGEASVWYMYSKNAVENIVNFNPRAKFIIILRHPVDMLYSLHSQMVYNMDEDELSFEKAWYLQESRKKGLHIPKHCRVHEFLQYSEIGKYSEQLKRVFNIVDKNRIKVFLLEDFQVKTLDACKSLMNFLEIDYDEQVNFSVINENKIYRSRLLHLFLHRTPSIIENVANSTYSLLGISNIGLMKRLNNIAERLNSKKTKRSPLPEEFELYLFEYFMDDIRSTESIINRDLNIWKLMSNSL